MLRRLADPSPRLARAGFILGLTLVAVLAVLDMDLGGDHILNTTVVLGPFAAAVVCSARQVAIVAAAAILAAVLSSLWTPDPGSADQLIRQACVIVGSGVAVLAAVNREAVVAGRRRLRLLASVAGGAIDESVEASAQRIAELAVPAFADLCTIDALRDGRPVRLGARLDHPDRELEEGLRNRLERLVGDAVSPFRWGEPTLVAITDDVLREGAIDAEDLDLMRRIGTASYLVAPMRARGQVVGALGLSCIARSGRRFEQTDVEFAQALADRTALALDNAGLSRELTETEAGYKAALDAMAAAILIQRPGEGITYANQAAAEAFGLPDAESVRTATPEEIASEWVSYNEAGDPLTADQFPSRKILTGVDDSPGPLYSHGVHKVTGREAWLSVKAAPVFDGEGKLLMAVSVSEDITSMKRAEIVKGTLARAGEVLSSSLDYERTLQDLAALTVPDLADWCAVSLPEPDGTIRAAAVAHRDPDKVAFAREYQRRFPSHRDDDGGAAAIMRDGQPLLMEVTEEVLTARITDPEQLAMLRELGLRSAIQVPIAPPGGEPLGVLTLVHAESGRSFSDDELQLASELGRRAGIAIQNAELFRAQAHTAAVLQRSLLPRDLPVLPGYDLAATYRPAGRHTWVGGDFYDAFETSSGWAVAVGDIAGKGVEAAALTAQSRHILRSSAQFTGDLADAVAHLNTALFDDGELSLCTVCAVALPGPATDGPARVICAGHPRPVLVRAGEATEVGAWGPLVGAFRDSRFTAVEVDLAPGDLLVLYTDGLVDARGEHDRFGPDRLHALMRRATGAREAVDLAEAELDAFQAGEQADDTALLVIERR